jgi:FkbM family methyltransferase
MSWPRTTSLQPSLLQGLVRSLPRALRRQKLLQLLIATRLVRPAQPAIINGHFKAWFDLRDAEARATFLSGEFWPEISAIVSGFLGTGGAMFDVGCNYGLVTLGTIPACVGRGVDYHLFEANPALIPLLERSVACWPSESIRVVQCCVTDTAGTSYHSIPGAHWGQGFIGQSGTPVPNVVLDDYIQRHGIRKIAFLKMDVEGHEPRALLGGQRTLSAGLVSAAFIELSAPSLQRSGSTADEVLDLVEALGFDCFFLRPVGGDHSERARRWLHAGEHLFELHPARPLPPSFEQDDVLCLHRLSDPPPNISFGG